MENRRDILMGSEDSSPLGEEEIENLKKRVSSGNAYQSLKHNFGWQSLVKEFIEPNCSEAKFLSAKREELADVQVSIRELRKMVEFVENKVQSGIKAFEILQKHRIK